jgi:Ca-activated chloride channel family protein
MLDLVQREARLLTNVAVLRWGVFGARHDDRDENLQLEELPTPVLKGIEPPLSKGYNRPFWLKHHVLPPFSPSVAELQTLAVPMRAEIAGYDRIERQVAAGRKLNERELRVEDFVAQGLGYLPAAPSNVIQLRAVAGPSPFGPANSAMLQLLVQAGQFRSVTPRHWVVAVDLSASMQRGGRWQGVKRMLSSFPERLGPEDRVSLVGFRDEVDVNLTALGPEDVTLWRETIRTLQPAGGADLFVGVREAVTRAFNEDGSPLPPAEIVIISDHEGLLTNTATRGMSELLREVQQAGHGVQLVDLSAAANRSPLQQLATAANVPRHGALAGSEPASALARWWSSVTPRVAADVKVQVKFDPKQVTAYRLVGHAAGSWSHVSTIADPIDLSPGDAACSLVEVALHPGTEGNVAEVQLEWRDPQTGNVRRERSQVAKREFLRPLHETPPAFQRVLCAAELAEVLNGTRVALREANWSSGEPHDLETVLNTMRQLTSPARSDPAAVQLLQLTESLRRQGIK